MFTFLDHMDDDTQILKKMKLRNNEILWYTFGDVNERIQWQWVVFSLEEIQLTVISVWFLSIEAEWPPSKGQRSWSVLTVTLLCFQSENAGKFHTEGRTSSILSQMYLGVPFLYLVVWWGIHCKQTSHFCLGGYAFPRCVVDQSLFTE